MLLVIGECWMRLAMMQQQELRDQLASEYALGEMQGQDRQRFERLLRKDKAMRRQVVLWQERLGLRPVARGPWRSWLRGVLGYRELPSLSEVVVWRWLCATSLGLNLLLLYCLWR